MNRFNFIVCIKQKLGLCFSFDFQRIHFPSSTFCTQTQIRSSLPLSHISEARARKGFRQLLLSSEGGWGREGRKQTEIFQSRRFTAVPITASPWFTVTETVRDRINERGKEKKTKD